MENTYQIIAIVAGIAFLAMTAGTIGKVFDRIDLRILSGIQRRLGPETSGGAPRVERAMRDLTALGGDMAMVLLLLAGCLLLIGQGRSEAALQFGAVLAAGRLIGWIVKLIIRRPRPQEARSKQGVQAFTSSFPSIHTLMTFVAAFSIIYACEIPAGTALIWSSGMAALVGFTRLYFAVHWPSDVLAGWLIALAISAQALVFFGA